MFGSAFNKLLPPKYAEVNLLPEALFKSIESDNSWIYDDINNGVYKSGFATSQDAYEKAVTTLFNSLDRVEAQLVKSGGPYFFGKELTETDVRLFTTAIRFDVVYVQHFKTNLRDIRSGYPAIHKWLRHLYWDLEPFGSSTQFEHIKKHYTKSHKQINPYVCTRSILLLFNIHLLTKVKSITPLGPEPPILKKDTEVNAAKAALQ